jgi:hypothetical protein
VHGGEGGDGHHEHHHAHHAHGKGAGGSRLLMNSSMEAEAFAAMESLGLGGEGGGLGEDYLYADGEALLRCAGTRCQPHTCCRPSCPRQPPWGQRGRRRGTAGLWGCVGRRAVLAAHRLRPAQLARGACSPAPATPPLPIPLSPCPAPQPPTTPSTTTTPGAAASTPGA